MTNWYAVNTHVQSEEKAAWHLRNQGFEVYLPRYLKRRRHARKTDLIKAPLFPRYLFVAIDMCLHQWRSINSTVGVARLVCTGSDPAPVPAPIIENIRVRENDDGIVVVDPRGRFKKGDAVRLLDGPFADVIGLFEGTTADERVMILLDLLGRQVKVRMKPELVEAAA
ncbi:MAG: transcription termination/antitermination NusG family protein [Rhodospirillales bacterium]